MADAPAGAGTAAATAVRGSLALRLGAALYAAAVSRRFAVGLALLALMVGIGSFFLITGDAPIGTSVVVGLVYLNLAVLLLLATVVIVRVVRVWAERRRGSAGAKLHIRLVLLFGAVAVVPTIAVGVLSAVLFSTGIQNWFSDPVRAAIDESMAASRAYLDEHQNAIRVDALAMAADINRAAPLLIENRPLFDRIVQAQTSLRGLTEASVFDAATRQVLSSGGMASSTVPEEVPVWARIYAAGGEVAVITGDENRVRALVKLDFGDMTFLLIGRPVDPTVIGHMVRTEAAVGEYRRLEQRVGRLQVSLAIIFDVSGSMNGEKINKARHALSRFIATSHPMDEYFLIAFNNKAQLLLDRSRDGEAVLRKLTLVEPKKDTALYDAVYLGVEKVMRGSHQKKAVLIISDGQDNASRYNFGEVRRLLKESDVVAYSIGIQGRNDAASEVGLQGQAFLDEISGVTGGKSFYPESDVEMDEIFERIALELRHQYSIGYTPKDFVPNGKWRKVKVKVKRPRGLPRLTVRARDGYYASPASDYR